MMTLLFSAPMLLRLFRFLFLPLLLFSTGWHYGALQVRSAWQAANIAAENKARAIAVQQAAISARVSADSAAKQAEIKTVFRDRIVYRDKEVPHEVIVHDDASCAIPNRFVSLWNSANRGEMPDASSQFDDAASDVKLSDVEAEKDREAEACIANAEQLKALQGWAEGSNHN